MYRIWFWAMIERESDGRFVAGIPDLNDLAAYGGTDKDAVAHVTELAREVCEPPSKAASQFRCGGTTTRCPATFDPRSLAAPSFPSKSSVMPSGRRRRIRCPLNPSGQSRPQKDQRRPWRGSWAYARGPAAAGDARQERSSKRSKPSGHDCNLAAFQKPHRVRLSKTQQIPAPLVPLSVRQRGDSPYRVRTGRSS